MMQNEGNYKARIEAYQRAYDAHQERVKRGERFILFLLVVIFTASVLLAMGVAHADRICPKGKSYRADLCYKVWVDPAGQLIVAPVGQSYRADKTWVMDRWVVRPKGKSYDPGQAWEVIK